MAGFNVSNCDGEIWYREEFDAWPVLCQLQKPIGRGYSCLGDGVCGVALVLHAEQQASMLKRHEWLTS